MKEFCEDCAKYETCEKAIGFEFGYCTTDFEPKKQEANEITIKLSGNEWARLLQILNQKSEECTELIKTKIEFAGDKYNEERYQYFRDYKQTIEEIILQIKTKVGL